MKKNRKPQNKSRTSPRLAGHSYAESKFYFLTICTANSRPVFVNPHHFTILEHVIGDYAETYQIELAAWCIMPDHLHLICTPCGNRSVTEYVRAVKSVVSRKLKHVDGPVWQRSFFDHIIRSSESLTQKIAYTVMNPVRRHLVSQPAEYQWSWDALGIKNRKFIREDE